MYSPMGPPLGSSSERSSSTSSAAQWLEPSARLVAWAAADDWAWKKLASRAQVSPNL